MKQRMKCEVCGRDFGGQANGLAGLKVHLSAEMFHDELHKQLELKLRYFKSKPEMYKLKSFIHKATAEAFMEGQADMSKFLTDKIVAETLSSVREKLQRECLDYCQAQNGLPYCKNCGLDLDLLNNLKEI